MYLQATTRPGAKLPHAWLVGADGRRVSTLDVTGKGKITLLTGLSAGRPGSTPPRQLDLPFLRTVVVGEPGTIDPYGYWRGSGRSTRPERSWSAPTATSPGGRPTRCGTTPRPCTSCRRR